MAKKKASLFAGGCGSVAEKIKKLSKSPSVQSAIDISEEALRERAEARKKLPKVSLLVQYSQIKPKGKIIKKSDDFTDLTVKYPHHEELVRQLIVGAGFTLPPGLNESCARNVFKSIREFVEGINSSRMLVNKSVRVVADIDLMICKAFCTYLTSVFPRRSCNRKRYGALRRIVHRLQEKYPNQPAIGKKFEWPLGPGNNDTPREGYFPHQMLELMEACKKDIISIQSFHRMYQNLTLEDGLRCENWNLENLMFYLHDAVQLSSKYTPKETVLKAFASNNEFRAFLNRERLMASQKRIMPTEH